MKKLIYTPFILLLFNACEKSSDTQPVVIQQGSFEVASQLRGYSVNPTNSSPATGTLSGAYDQKSGILSFQLTFDSMVPTEAHIHKGYFPGNGPIIYSIPVTSPELFSGSIYISPADAAILASGGYYADIHSRAFEKGEVRGQIEKSN